MLAFTYTYSSFFSTIFWILKTACGLKNINVVKDQRREILSGISYLYLFKICFK